MADIGSTIAAVNPEVIATSNLTQTQNVKTLSSDAEFAAKIAFLTIPLFFVGVILLIIGLVIYDASSGADGKGWLGVAGLLLGLGTFVMMEK